MPLRFYSKAPEAAAAGTDAFDKDSWADSDCPWCHRRQPEFVLLYPPHDLARAAVMRAHQDQAQGIAILPCAHTAPWWHTVMAASRSPVRPLQPFHRLRCSDKNVEHRTSPPGFFLAVFHFDFWQGDSPRPRCCAHGPLSRPADPDSVLNDALDCAAYEAGQ